MRFLRFCGLLTAIIITIFVIIGFASRMKKSTQSNSIKDRIERIASRFDGSCPVLEKYVKSKMNDPESYEHVSTVYFLPKDNNADLVTFKTVFRGKNRFGGVVTQTVFAVVNIRTGVVSPANND